MNWLRNFMAGRYGGDQLNIALILLYLVLAIVAQITQLWVIWIAEILLLAYCFFRILSRNVEKRYRENQKFLRLWNPIKQRLLKMKIRVSDRAHRYYHCPKCKNTLRVPRGKGKICITCPVCKTEFIKKT
ncbi:MAG: hypothetical protein HFE39_01985 [Clostridiales bacterium]|jgi:hypothetical protein|nr:hypothetical protein [Clostridiales bacterium]